MQAPAPRVFDLNRHNLAARVIHLDGYAPEHYVLAQAIAPRIFHLNYHAFEQAAAPRVFRLNRRDLTPIIFHFNHHIVRQALAPGSFASGLDSWSRNLRDSDCLILTDEADFLR